MKPLMYNGLVVAVCLIFSAGCSSLKPKADQPAVVESHPCLTTDPPALVSTNNSPSKIIQGMVNLAAALFTLPQKP
jgi:hypothetical protein